MAIAWPGTGLSPNLTIWFPGDFHHPHIPTFVTSPLESYSFPPTVRTTRLKSTSTRTPHTKRPTKTHHTTKRPTTKHTKRPTTYRTTTKQPRPTKHTTPRHTKHTQRPHHTTSTQSHNGSGSLGGGGGHGHTKAPTTTEASSDVWVLDLTWDDATWILTASFIIFTMQTGFGMLESGCVSVKNEANIMMKNVVDIVFGGLTYWIFGFSLSFGADPGSTPFAGVGEYVVDSNYEIMGPVFAAFMFQLSFATTATTIVSGTMAERCNFKSYCVFSLLNTIVYCVPARWVWGPGGFLSELGCIDIAGSGAVHLLGGVSGYVAAWMLGPRLGRYDNGTDPLPLGNPTNCIVGLYILWWGWLAFNSGSTFGVSGVKWKFAARAAVTTMIASIGGGLIGSIWTLSRPGRIFQVMDIVNPVLGALVGVTAGCALYHTFDALVVGIIGGIVVILTGGFADFTRVDDPVGATAVHAFGGLWGLVAVGLFAEDDKGAGFSKGNAGVLRGGTFYLLLIQLLAVVCITAWAVIITFILLWIINKILPIRMEPHEELLGADFVEHLIRRRNAGITPILSVVGSHPHIQEITRDAVVIGTSNPIHDSIFEAIDEISGRKRWKKLRTAAMAVAVVSTKLKSLSRQASQSNKVEGANNNYLGETNYNTQYSTPLGSHYNQRSTWNYKDFLGDPNGPVKRY